MPTPINDAESVAALVRRFFIKGRLPLSLDETVVPVVVLANVEAQQIAGGFGDPPGPDLSTRGWGLVQAPGPGFAQALVVRAGVVPLLIERVLLWSNAATLFGVFKGRQVGGTIVTGGGSWAARRPGSPSAEFIVQSMTPDMPLVAEDLLAVIPTGSFEVDGNWVELNLALQAGAQGTLTTLTIAPLNESTPNFPTVNNGGGLAVCSLQWRE